MAELFWKWEQYQLPENIAQEIGEGLFGGPPPTPAANIGQVMDALANTMQNQGWQGVQHQQDVHGVKPGIDLFAAVTFLPITGNTFWQAVAVGGGTASQQQAQQELGELQNMIANMKFM